MAGFAIFASAINVLSAGSQEVRIAALISHEGVSYQKTLQGFSQYLDTHQLRAMTSIYPLNGEAAKAESALQEIKLKEVKLILAIGSLAADASLRGGANIPIIATLSLEMDKMEQLSGATGIDLEFPPEVHFQWLKTILPTSKTIGVLFNPEENLKRIERSAMVAQKMGLRLNAQSVDHPSRMPDALDALAKTAGVLWGISDRLVLNPQTAKEILLFSFRNRIPFIGPSEAWVKAGALYALDRDYIDLGMQCGQMAAKILKGMSPAAIPNEPPRKMLYYLNLRTARHMKIDISEDLVSNANGVF